MVIYYKYNMSEIQWESLQLDIQQNAKHSTTIATNTKNNKTTST